MRAALCLAIAALLAGVSWSQVPPKKRVAVFDFENAAVQGVSSGSQRNSPDVGKGVAELLILKLVENGDVTVVERSALDKVLAEQNFSNSDRADPATAARLGRLLGVDAIILGTITRYEYEEKIKGGGPAFFGGAARSPNAKYDITAKVQISTRLISPDTAEVLAVSAGLGESSRKNVKVDLRDTGGRLVMASGTNSPVLNESVHKAISQLATRLQPELAKVPSRLTIIEGLVADANESGQLILNVGARNGVRIGDHFQVLRAGKEIRDPANGRLLLRDDTALGEAFVTSVNDISAIAEYHGSQPVKVNDLVKSIPK